MSALLHLSDLHFGTERPPVVEALLDMARQAAPAVVVISGDLTQRATTAEFAKAQRFVERLAAPVLLVVPGNHDIPLFDLRLRLLAPYARYCRVFGPELEPRFESAAWHVQTLNTTRAWRHKNGGVSAQQVEQVAAALAGATADQLRVVVVHQPIAVARAQDEPHLLRGRHRAMRRWAEAGADIVLGGHIHLPFVLGLHERNGGLPRRLWAVQAGTAVSSRVRHEAGNSVNLLRPAVDGTRAGCEVERWDFDTRAGAFRRVALHRLACGAVSGV